MSNRTGVRVCPTCSYKYVIYHNPDTDNCPTCGNYEMDLELNQQLVIVRAAQSMFFEPDTEEKRKYRLGLIKGEVSALLRFCKILDDTCQRAVIEESWHFFEYYTFLILKYADPSFHKYVRKIKDNLCH